MFVETQIMDWLQTPSPWKAIVSFLLLIALAFVPFMPIAVVFGAVGFSYPLPVALFINITGSLLGAVLMFLLCKYGLRGYYERKIQHINSESAFIKLMKTNSFLAIVIARFIPILPSAVVNIVCAMFQVPTRIYVAATLLGKLPSILIYTLVGNQLLENNVGIWMIVALYAVIILYFTKKYRQSWKM